MTEAEMKQRTQQFALRILKLAEALPKTKTGHAIANQIARSGTSVGANYRALCRSKSRADFVNETSIIEEEADETAFWLEMIGDVGLLSSRQVEPLLKKANELVAMAGRQSKNRHLAQQLEEQSRIEIRKFFRTFSVAKPVS